MSPDSAQDLYELAVSNPRQLRQYRTELENHLTSQNRDENLYASDATRKFAYSCPRAAAPLDSALSELTDRYARGDQIYENTTKARSYLDSSGSGDAGATSSDTKVYDAGTSETEVYDDSSANRAEYELNFCPSCGVDLRSLTVPQFCPECGTELS